jgi:methionyl-tRNA synthetase
LSRYDPDALRYYLTVNMPEMKDSNWNWAEFVTRNNNELVATWGNLANRMLSFAYKHWDGHVPPVDESTLRPADLELLAAIENGFQTVGAEYEAVHLRAAVTETMKLATAVNQYLDFNAPWNTIKTDRASAALTVFTALKAIDSLKVLFSPVLPFSAERLHTFFGYETPLFGEQYIEEIQDALGTHKGLRYRPLGSGQWKPSQLKPAQKLRQPSPLFKKLDESLIEEEIGRLKESLKA